jgi:tol-pal system protein YbgF
MRSTKHLAIATLFLAASPVFGASREQQEMQRDIAQLQDQVKALQSSFDQKMSVIQVLVQQALEAGNKANTGVTVLNSTVNQTLDRELQSKLSPIAGLAAKVDNTNNDVSEVRNSVADLNTSMNKVLQKLNDLDNILKVMSAPPAAPPQPATPAGPVVPPASTLFTNAVRDQNGGKFDLAISEFNDFLKFYPDDPNAASAQLNIGEAHAAQGKYDQAAQDFDAVVERYPANDITPDALYSKGTALRRAGRKTEAIATFRAVIAKYPRKDQAAQAKDQLKEMGVATAAPAAAPPVRRKK